MLVGRARSFELKIAHVARGLTLDRAVRTRAAPIIQLARASDAHVNSIGGRKPSSTYRTRSLIFQKRNSIIIHTALQKILAALPRPKGPTGIP